MKVIYNRYIPLKGYDAINLFGVLFIREEYSDSNLGSSFFNHESIHTAQMKDFCSWLPVGGTIFYLVYVWYFLLGLVEFDFRWKTAYRSIPFEVEAYSHENETTYLETRKKFAWKL